MNLSNRSMGTCAARDFDYMCRYKGACVQPRRGHEQEG
jgi:hypothetical protein